MSKVLIAEGLGYNLLSISHLMAQGIHLKADSTSQEFKLYHGKGGLYIAKAVMKNNVFVLDFVPDLGTANSDGIVTFTSWTHPPDLDPNFSPEGFWYLHTIPEAERTRALATIQHSAAAEPTSAAAETTSAAAETTSAAAETTAAAAATSTPIAGPSTASTPIDDTPPTPARQLNPAPREVHRSANFTASFYSNSDLYRRSPGHRAGEDIWHARMGHQSNTVLNNTIRAGVLDKDSLLLTDGSELRRARGTAPAYTPLEKVYSDILYNREPGQGAYNYTITFIDAATRYVWHLNLLSKDMAFEAFVAWLPAPSALPRHGPGPAPDLSWPGPGPAPDLSQPCPDPPPAMPRPSPCVLTFDAEGRAVDFDVWLDDLQLFLQCDSKDGLSLFDLTSGASTAPAADADSTVRSQWLTRNAAARLAVRSHLPSTERAHFSQYKSAKTLYDAVVARYSSPATAALSRLMLPYLFPDLAAFTTVTDLITHLRTSDTRYRAALPAEFCAQNPPPPHVHHPLLPSHPTP
ncbi:unnamed protein product [Closterium sp. NIES-53]